jgi:alkanesulfonate monooxygenase SsuD/methylene tetrahydromethanopterin reductase-like flavin-dependent oxidoreductase (luciferase family)
MRIGISWDLGELHDDTQTAWRTAVAEAVSADRLGYDSVWVRESREPGGCPAPAVMLTWLSRQTTNVALREVRGVTVANPVRIAEEVAVLDVFSRGRAGIAFAAAGPQGVPASHVHEVHDFVACAWASDEMRFAGEHVRFPAHTPDDVGPGASLPPAGREYLPQWEWGPRIPDFLTITPKPFASRPPTFSEILDDDTLEWAAANGVSPFVSADTATAEAVERLERYRSLAERHGRRHWQVEVVLERRMELDGTTDDHVLGGDVDTLVTRLRDIAAVTGVTHLVWRRGAGAGDMFRFALEVHPLLQT